MASGDAGRRTGMARWRGLAYVISMTPHPAPPPLSVRPAVALLPLAMILALGAMWGLAFSFSKMASNAGVHPLAYTFWQGLGAGTLVVVLGALRGARLRLDRAHLRYYFATGLLSIALPNVNLMTAIGHLPAGVIVLTIPFVPLITYALAVALKMERFDPLRLSGVLFGLAGLALIVLPRASLPDAEAAPWFLLALATPAFYAVGNVMAARLRPEGAASLPLAAGMLLAAAAILALPVFVSGVFFVPRFPPGGAEFGVAGQIVISSVAYILFFEVLRLAGPVYMSFTGYIVTLSGIAWGIVIFGERHSPWVWGAAALIFSGLLLVNLRRGAAGR